ncbi:MAG: M67 family metallopeptidase [Pseudomonadota bacterium]
MGTSITLTSGAVATLLGEAAAAAPREACGLLLGTGSHVSHALPAANVAPDPNCHFEIDPAALIAAHKAARAGGAEVLGYWHSHPNGRSGPSATDRAGANGDGRVWVIVANGAITCWRDGAAGFEPLSSVIDDG